MEQASIVEHYGVYTYSPHLEINKTVTAGDRAGHQDFFIATRDQAIHGDGAVPEDEAAAAGGNQAIPGYGAGYRRSSSTLRSSSM